jgi:hypothetical protein
MRLLKLCVRALVLLSLPRMCGVLQSEFHGYLQRAPRDDGMPPGHAEVGATRLGHIQGLQRVCDLADVVAALQYVSQVAGEAAAESCSIPGATAACRQAR